MSVIKRAFSALGKLGIIVAIAVAFFAGLIGTVYYSLRSREVNVPNIVGKDILEGEKALDHDGLNMRRRATRYSPNAKPNTILDQSPHAGEIIKVGQTVAVVVSRSSAKEGEEGVSNSADANVAEEEKSTSTENSTSKNDNGNTNKGNKNTKNKNSNNSNNANGNSNRNSNANNSNNRNTNNRNTNNRNTNNGKANSNQGTTNSGPNSNTGALNTNSGRSNSTTNSNKKPAVTTTPTNQNRNRRVP